jgi:hypothetical protein
MPLFVAKGSAELGRSTSSSSTDTLVRGILILNFSTNSLQIKKSSLQGNKAIYGGGVFLVSGNMPTTPPLCPVSTSKRIIYAVHLDQVQFQDNQCGPHGVGAGASVFWNQPYILDITCMHDILTNQSSTWGQPEDIVSRTLDACPSTRGYRYCHQCMHVQGCSEWHGNHGGFTGVLGGISSAYPLSSHPVEEDAAKQMDLKERLASVLHVCKRGHPGCLQHKNAVSKAVASWHGRSLQQADATGVGIASGPVAMRPITPVVEGYAAGSILNITVQVLPPYVCYLHDYLDIICC